jgi:hypothetical protein
MHQSSIPIILLVFLSLTNLSCKKKNNPQPDPKPVVKTLSLAYQRNVTTDWAFLSMSAAASDNHLYVSGGMNYGTGSDLYIYTPSSTQWERVPLSQIRSSSSVTYLKGKVFVAGGDYNTADQYRIDIYDENTKTSSVKLLGDYMYGHPTFSAIIENRYVVFYDYNYLYVYDTITGNWETIDNPLPTRITITGMVVIGTKLYFNEVYNPNFIKIFDFKTRTWSSISSLQHASNTKLLSLDDRIYFYGNSSFIPLDHIDVFDVKTGIWSKIMLPGGRTMYDMSIDPKSKSLVITGGRIFEVVDAGYIDAKISNDLLIYNLEDKNWERLKLNTARYATTGQFVSNYFIVHGGSATFNEYPLVKLPTEVYLVNYK